MNWEGPASNDHWMKLCTLHYKKEDEDKNMTEGHYCFRWAWINRKHKQFSSKSALRQKNKLQQLFGRYSAYRIWHQWLTLRAGLIATFASAISGGKSREELRDMDNFAAEVAELEPWCTKYISFVSKQGHIPQQSHMTTPTYHNMGQKRRRAAVDGPTGVTWEYSCSSKKSYLGDFSG